VANNLPNPQAQDYRLNGAIQPKGSLRVNWMFRHIKSPRDRILSRDVIKEPRRGNNIAKSTGSTLCRMRSTGRVGVITL
jgi:hypothetical protein